MTWKKKITISLLTGFSLAGLGIGLVSLGGWGPCGPGSMTAVVGGYLSIGHLIFWESILPGFEDSLRHLHFPDIVSVALVPAIDFSVLAFLSFVAASVFRKKAPLQPPVPTRGNGT